MGKLTPLMRAIKNSLDSVTQSTKNLSGMAKKHVDKIDADIARRNSTDKDAVNYVRNGNTVTQTRGGNTKTTAFDPKTNRPIMEMGTIRKDFGSSRRGDRATKVGRDYGRDADGNRLRDDGGHIGAHRFFGDSLDIGIVPQNFNLNRGAWNSMESKWASLTDEGMEVNYLVEVFPPGSERPDAFQVTYEVFNPKTGQSEGIYSVPFANQAGHSFNPTSMS